MMIMMIEINLFSSKYVIITFSLAAYNFLNPTEMLVAVVLESSSNSMMHSRSFDREEDEVEEAMK